MSGLGLRIRSGLDLSLGLGLGSSLYFFTGIGICPGLGDGFGSDKVWNLELDQNLILFWGTVFVWA
eukprot:3967833-Ditylum_brightwellii.AAC.1